MQHTSCLVHEDGLRLCQLCCRLTIFVVYNAYPERSKTETREKRLTCISWMFGCYKTMIQQVEGRQVSCSHHIPYHTMRKQLPRTRAYCPATECCMNAMPTMGGCSAFYSSQPQKAVNSTVSDSAPGFQDAADVCTYVPTGWSLECAPTEGQVLRLSKLNSASPGASQVCALDQRGTMDVRPIWARRPHAI